MPGPILWGPNNIATNLQNAELLANGSLISYNGPKNYITYGNFENGATTGWSLGTIGTLVNGLPTGSPTFGSGAAGTLSIATVSSGQIAGLYSLSLVSSAATTQGNMVASQAYTIDAEDQGKVLTYKLAYSTPSGVTNANFSGTSSNSFGVGVYDVTNSAWLGVTGAFNLVQNSGVGIATGTFQTAITTASIRLVFYCVNATTGAVTVYLDDISVGPQVTAAGSAMSDLTAYTLSLTGSTTNPTPGTATRNEARWARRGDMMYIRYDYIAGAGSGGSGDLLFSIPAGVTIDSAKVTYASGSTAGTSVVGNGGYWASTAGNTPKIPVNVVAYNSTNLALKVVDDSSNNYVTTANLAGAQVLFSFECLVPITGWSSQTVMSSDTDTRVVAALIGGDPASATSGNPIIVPTVVVDTHGAYNASTGRYTVPVTGIYKMYGALQSASSATTLTIYKNAVSTSLAGNLDSNGEATFASAVNCAAGDLIDLRPGGTVDATSMTLNIERISGPATIAASEKVYLQYTGNAGNAITANVTNLTWSTKVVDSHNAWNGTTFTAPKTGLYYISGTVLGTSTGNLFYIYKNSVQNVMLNGSGATSARHGLIGQIYLLAGDTVTVREDGSDTLTNSATDHSIAISSQG